MSFIVGAIKANKELAQNSASPLYLDNDIVVEIPNTIKQDSDSVIFVEFDSTIH